MRKGNGMMRRWTGWGTWIKKMVIMMAVVTMMIAIMVPGTPD